MEHSPDCGVQSERETPACGEKPSARTAVRWQNSEHRQSDRRRPATLTTGRRIALLLLALLSLAGAAFLLRGLSRESRPGVHSHRRAAAAPGDAGTDSSLRGFFRLSAFSAAGGEEELPTEGEGYLIFNGDGSGVACLPGSAAQRFTCSADKLFFDDGTALSYRVEGDTVTLCSGAALIFTHSDTQAEEAGQSGDTRSGRWTGVLEISKHKGSGVLRDGKLDVWGQLGEAEDGRQYFELFALGDRVEDGRPILSMWVRTEGERIVPVIGEEDAWFFDVWLESADEEALSMDFGSGELRCRYRYIAENESCTVSFRLTPEPG